MRALDEKVSKKIESVLTDEQKKAIPEAMKTIGELGQAGIPADVMPEMKLTAAQKTKILSITEKARTDQREKMQDAQQNGDFQAMREIMQSSRQQTQKAVRAVLTESQRDTVDKFVKEHPMRGPGGFGGPGGPGGFGGPGGRPGGPGGPGGQGGPGEGPPPPPAG